MYKNIKKTIIFCLLIFVFMSFFVIPVYAQDDEQIENTIREQLKLDLIIKEMLENGVDMDFHYDEVPLYNQMDYPDIPYGDDGTIASHGCGITALAMVATYLTDIEYTPVMMAEQFGAYNTPVGSKWSLFEDSAEVLCLNLEKRAWYWEHAKAALQNGQIVIALVNSDSIFTNGGHFIVLTGLTEDGKVLVNDPYGNNYKHFPEKFENGFKPSEIYGGAVAYWIYGKKETRQYSDNQTVELWAKFKNNYLKVVISNPNTEISEANLELAARWDENPLLLVRL